MHFNKKVFPSKDSKIVSIGCAYNSEQQIFVNRGTGEFWQSLSILDNDERKIQSALLKKRLIHKKVFRVFIDMAVIAKEINRMPKHDKKNNKS